MPGGQYGQSYLDNNGSRWNWNESLKKYTRAKKQQRNRSGTPTINTSASSQQYKNRRAIKVNPDGKTRNTVGGKVTGSGNIASNSSKNPKAGTSAPDKEVISSIIRLAKQSYTIDEIVTKVGLSNSGVNRIISLALEAGHKIGKKTKLDVLNEQLFEYLEYGDETEEVQKALSEISSEVLQKSEPLVCLPNALPVTLDHLRRLMKSRTEYKMAQIGHNH